MKRSIKIFVLLLAAKSFVWSGSFNAIEFVELLKKLRFPKKRSIRTTDRDFLPNRELSWNGRP